MKNYIILATLLALIANLSAETKQSKTLIYGNDFNADNFTKEVGFKGTWRSLEKKIANGNKVLVENGALFVSHPKEIKHPLGVFWDLNKGLFLTDVAVSAKFKIQEGNEMTVGFTGENFTTGHSRIFMMTFKSDGFSLADASGKGTHKKTAVKTSLAAGVWHTFKLEIKGEKCTVTVNDLAPAVLEAKGLAYKKQTFKLGTKTSFEIDDLNLWALNDEKK